MYANDVMPQQNKSNQKEPEACAYATRHENELLIESNAIASNRIINRRLGTNISIEAISRIVLNKLMKQNNNQAPPPRIRKGR
jgi:hypothetical protein